MNTKRFLLAGAIGALTIFSSCKKDNDTTNPSTSSGGKVTCKIDGEEWKSESIIRAEIRRLVLGTDTYSKTLLLSAKGDDGSTLSLTITDVYIADDGTDCLNDITIYSVNDPDFEKNFMTTTAEGTNYSSGVACTITRADGSFLLNDTGSTTVEGCEGETINGNFGFESIDSNDILLEEEEAQPVKITEGKFTDIKYTVL